MSNKRNPIGGVPVMVDYKHREYQGQTTGKMDDWRRLEIKLDEPLDGVTTIFVWVTNVRVLS
jgi:hypothetical protein